MRIATINRELRLVVVNFTIKTDLVPDVIPLRTTISNRNYPELGSLVLPSTKNVYLLTLLEGIRQLNGAGEYELVHCWKLLQADPKKMDVRFVFCHKSHIIAGKLNPDFVAKRDELIEAFVNIADDNLWAVQGHLNPYYLPDDSTSGDHVLMLDCNNRQATVEQSGYKKVMTYRDGRDIFGQGLGPRVPLIDLAKKMVVASGEVRLDS